MDTTYKIYCMGTMLCDKYWSYLYDASGTIMANTKRMYDRDRGVLGSLYDLTYPSTLITDNIYLGNSYNAKDYYDLNKNNIGLIVNTTTDMSNYYDSYFEYVNIHIRDINGANLLPYIDEVVDKMHTYLTENPNKKILVHCFMGSSRSASIVISYLMKYKKWSLRDSLNYITNKRPVVNLNIDFYNQLIQYEKKINK